MKHTVQVTTCAERDLTAILDWLSERSLQGANAWFEVWLKTCSELSQNASAASLAPENPDHEEEIRQWFFKTPKGRRYRALFIIRDNVVFILNVRGSGEEFVSKDELGNPSH